MQIGTCHIIIHIAAFQGDDGTAATFYPGFAGSSSFSIRFAFDERVRRRQFLSWCLCVVHWWPYFLFLTMPAMMPAADLRQESRRLL